MDILSDAEVYFYEQRYRALEYAQRLRIKNVTVYPNPLPNTEKSLFLSSYNSMLCAYTRCALADQHTDEYEDTPKVYLTNCLTDQNAVFLRLLNQLYKGGDEYVFFHIIKDGQQVPSLMFLAVAMLISGFYFALCSSGDVGGVAVVDPDDTEVQCSSYVMYVVADCKARKAVWMTCHGKVVAGAEAMPTICMDGCMQYWDLCAEFDKLY